MPSLEPANYVRGQFKGYSRSRALRPNSQTETFAAFKLEIDSWRWKGVPFYIRAGKCLPVTCTEIIVRLQRPTDHVPQFHASRRITAASASAPK